MSYMSFSQHNRMTSFIFSTEFLKDFIHDNWTSTVQGGVMRINYITY
jgi:hypothetical protein